MLRKRIVKACKSIIGELFQKPRDTKRSEKD